MKTRFRHINVLKCFGLVSAKAMNDSWANNHDLKRVFKTARDMVRADVEAAKTATCPNCNGKGTIEMPRDLHKSGGYVPCGHFTDKHYCAKGKWVKRNGY